MQLCAAMGLAIDVSEMDTGENTRRNLPHHNLIEHEQESTDGSEIGRSDGGDGRGWQR